jgi:hypothetical protein
MPSCETLIQWSRLNYSLVGKLFVRRCDDAQSWGGLSFRSHGGFPSEAAKISLFGTFRWRIAWLGRLLQARLDELSLLFSDRYTSLQLLPHGRILCDETWGETGQSHVLDSQSCGIYTSSCQLTWCWSRGS